jgi:hypothetical protein
MDAAAGVDPESNRFNIPISPLIGLPIIDKPMNLLCILSPRETCRIHLEAGVTAPGPPYILFSVIFFRRPWRCGGDRHCELMHYGASCAALRWPC